MVLVRHPTISLYWHLIRFVRGIPHNLTPAQRLFQWAAISWCWCFQFGNPLHKRILGSFGYLTPLHSLCGHVHMFEVHIHLFGIRWLYIMLMGSVRMEVTQLEESIGIIHRLLQTIQYATARVRARWNRHHLIIATETSSFEVCKGSSLNPEQYLWSFLSYLFSQYMAYENFKL